MSLEFDPLDARFFETTTIPYERVLVRALRRVGADDDVRLWCEILEGPGKGKTFLMPISGKPEAEAAAAAVKHVKELIAEMAAARGLG